MWQRLQRSCWQDTVWQCGTALGKWTHIARLPLPLPDRCRGASGQIARQAGWQAQNAEQRFEGSAAVQPLQGKHRGKLDGLPEQREVFWHTERTSRNSPLPAVPAACPGPRFKQGAVSSWLTADIWPTLQALLFLSAEDVLHDDSTKAVPTRLQRLPRRSSSPAAAQQLQHRR